MSRLDALSRAVLRAAGRLPEPADVVTVRSIIGRVRDVMRDEPTITAVGVVEQFEREAGKIPLRAPVAISDEVVEEGAIRAWLAVWDGVKTRADWQFYDEVEKRVYRQQARAVLEYAASIGGVTPASPVSRPFRQTPDMPQLAILNACARGNLSELATIHRLAEYIAMRERDALRCAEFHGSPRMTIPLPTSKPRADRLADYRCAALTGLLASGEFYDKKGGDADQATHAENIAHAMLAAERSPTRG